MGTPPTALRPRPPPRHRAHASGAHRRARHAHVAEVPPCAGHPRWFLDRLPPASSRHAWSTSALRACCSGGRCPRVLPCPSALRDAPSPRQGPCDEHAGSPDQEHGSGAAPGVMGMPRVHTARRHPTGAGLLRPCARGEGVRWGRGGLAQRCRRPRHVARPARCLLVWGRKTRLVVGSPHALAARRPAPGMAPTEKQTPSQVKQGLLAWGVSS